jgi:hypothetical protein
MKIVFAYLKLENKARQAVRAGERRTKIEDGNASIITGKAYWVIEGPPKIFKLSTKLGFYTRTDREMVPQTTKPNLGKSYWINDQEIAEVTEKIKRSRPFLGQPCRA